MYSSYICAETHFGGEVMGASVFLFDAIAQFKCLLAVCNVTNVCANLGEL